MTSKIIKGIIASPRMHFLSHRPTAMFNLEECNIIQTGTGKLYALHPGTRIALSQDEIERSGLAYFTSGEFKPGNKLPSVIVDIVDGKIRKP